MLGRALKMAFWVTYDHLGKLILLNLVFACTVLVPGIVALMALLSDAPALRAGVGLPLLALTAGVLWPVVAAGLAHTAKQLIDVRDGAFGDFLAGIRLYWRRAVAIGVLYAVSVVCLVTSAWFYSTVFRDSLPWVGFSLGALAVWCLVFVSLVNLLAIPALVQKGAGVLETIKVAALLVLDNPVFVLGLAVQVVAFAAVSAIIAPLMFFLSGSATVVLVTSAYEQLARKYALLEAQESGLPVSAEGAPLEGFAGGLRVVSRKGALVVDEDEDDYLNRGLRDALFPWKG